MLDETARRYADSITTDPMDRPVTFEDLYDIFLFAELETDGYSERDLFSRLRGKVEKQARNGS